MKLAEVFNATVSYLIGETSEINALENVKATAMNNSIANVNVNGTINATEQNIIFEYEEGENRVRLIFPNETPGEIIDQRISAILREKRETTTP